MVELILFRSSQRFGLYQFISV